MITNLVGGFNPSVKYESVGIIVPNIWKNKKCSKPPNSNGVSMITNYCILLYNLMLIVLLYDFYMTNGYSIVIANGFYMITMDYC